jgi:hypothetical protein
MAKKLYVRNSENTEWVEVANSIQDISNYLTINSASSTYLTKTSASSTYQTALSVGNGLTLNSSTVSVNPGAMLNAIVDGTSGNSYGIVGTSTYLDVKDTNGYNKEIELDIAAVQSQLVTDGFLKNSSASGTYLTQTSASTTYATKTELANIDLSSASAAAVAAIVDSAPSTLNTLNELAAALNDDANFSSTVTTALGNKLDSSSASTTYLTQVSASTQYEKLIPYSSSAPLSPAEGDLWVDSTVPTIKAYISSEWVSVGGGASDSDQGIISGRMFI